MQVTRKIRRQVILAIWLLALSSSLLAPLRPGMAQQGSSEFAFVAPPSISVETYQAVYCQPRHGRVSAACPHAPEMYQLLVEAGIDPAIELAFAAKESEFGITGPGRVPQHNIHNIVCNSWDGGSCSGPHHWRFSTYSGYVHAIQAWIHLMLHHGYYVDAGRATFRQVIPVYAPSFENNTNLYIAQVESWVRRWRSWEGIQQQQFPIASAAIMKTSTGSSRHVAAPPVPPPILEGLFLPDGTHIEEISADTFEKPPPLLNAPDIPEEAIAVDNSDFGFSANQGTWQPERCGVNGDYIATVSTNTLSQSSSRASWLAHELFPGIYEVRVYVPRCGSADATTSARYRITHDGGQSDITIDQHTRQGEWVSLGSYLFGERLNPMVEISNLTEDEGRTVRLDAVAWVPRHDLPPQAQQESIEQVQSLSAPPNRVPLPPQRTFGQQVARYLVPRLDEAWRALTLPEQQLVEVVTYAGNLRTEPRVDDHTVIAEVCKGDTLAVLEEQQIDDHPWLRVRVAQTTDQCVPNRAAAEAEGWVSRTVTSLDEDKAIE